MDKLKKDSASGGEAKRNGSLPSPERLEGNVEQLLPGLQNDIVLERIVPKLPWRSFHVLSSVSSYWRNAIKSHQVHDARARHNSLETLVVMNHYHPDGSYIHVISLYSLRKDSWHQLPEFPFFKQGIPRSCCCVALEGSLYILGGEPHENRPGACIWVDSVLEQYDSDGRPFVPNTGREVYMLDLVGQSGWKRCADLPKPKCKFACGVLNGKIYVLGGYTTHKSTNECCVYDPKEDRWSSIAPMKSKRNDHHVVAVGDELWVHGGWCGQDHRMITAEVYCPSKDEWDCDQPQHFYEFEHLFTVKGKLYMITPNHIYVREESTKSNGWTQLQSIIFDDPEEQDDVAEIVGAQAVDNEILVLCVVNTAFEPELFLYRSNGFGDEQLDILLVVVEEEIHFDHRLSPAVMRPIDL